MIEFVLKEKEERLVSEAHLGFVDHEGFEKWVRKVGGVRLIPGEVGKPLVVVVDHGEQGGCRHV